MPLNDSVRLNKYISESGICSRREADRYIEQGNVLINGKKAKIGDQVFRGDRVVVNGNEIEAKTKEDDIFLAFNKPVGVTSTTEASTKGNIVDYVNHSQRIFPVGRLDKDSQGLIFLTNNGDVVNKILRAGNMHEKEYLVTVNKPVTDQFIEGMSGGVPILGSVTKRCLITKEAPLIFKITLIQGMNRQIRRMCEYFGYEVTKLERIRIMNVSLKGIPLGEWRELTEPELKGIFKMIENSSSEGNSASKGSAKKKPARKDWDERPSRGSGATQRTGGASSRSQKAGDTWEEKPARKKSSNYGGAAKAGGKPAGNAGRAGRSKPKSSGPPKSVARVGKSKPSVRGKSRGPRR